MSYNLKTVKIGMGNTVLRIAFEMFPFDEWVSSNSATHLNESASVLRDDD